MTFPASLVGVRDRGQTVVRGPLLDLEARLDARFVAWARAFGADEVRHPPVMDAATLDRLGWFGNFPHLATFPVSLDDAALDTFAAAPRDADGALRLDRLAPARHVMTPAACYPVYADLEGARLDGPRVVTVRATCYRRETTYTPLERQWAFGMREIVVIGTKDEVTERLDALVPRVTALQDALGFGATWEHATDPFFRPARNPAYLVQKLEPVKRELVFDGRLAIASVNLHHDHFGHAFDLHRDGAPAFTGCLAFGLERWLAAFLRRHGHDPARWPDLREDRGA